MIATLKKLEAPEIGMAVAAQPGQRPAQTFEPGASPSEIERDEDRALLAVPARGWLYGPGRSLARG